MREPPSFWQMARAFLRDYCADQRRLSPDTVYAYKTGLESFLDCLESQGVARPDVGFQHFTRERFKSWAAWMRDDRGHAPKTV
ncbi:MAG: integrase, partial [Bifidobacteriaceae bacterium]|nr:integrase [Bifidobacteriaceae bacterium]